MPSPGLLPGASYGCYVWRGAYGTFLTARRVHLVYAGAFSYHVAWVKMREKPAGIVALALAAEMVSVPASGDDEITWEPLVSFTMVTSIFVPVGMFWASSWIGHQMSHCQRDEQEGECTW